MRVLVVSHTYITAENRRKLEAMGRSAEVLALVPQQGTDLAGCHDLTPSRSGAYTLEPLPVIGGTWPGTRWFFTRVREPWKRFRPEVVLVEQEVWSLALMQALLMRRLYAPGSVLGVFAWESQRRPGWKGAVAGLFYRLASHAAKVVLVGNRDARRLFLSHGADPSRVFVLPQVGLDPQRLSPATREAREALRTAAGVGPDVFLVGFAGRLVAEKGILDLLEAVCRLSRAGRATRLVVIGDGPLRGLLAQRLAQGDPISLRPPVPRQELAPFYQALDAFVLPSRTTPTWKEQFGMVLAEAMACGVPVVGSTSGAIPDVVDSAGLLYREGEVAELEAALARLASDAGFAAELGRRGRARSLRLFSHEAVADQTLAALRRATGEDAQGPIQYWASVEDSGGVQAPSQARSRDAAHAPKASGR